MKNCALTGHRELPADFNAAELYDALETLISEGYDTFYCGMAVGFDLLALSCLVELKEKYRITLIACIPHRGQENCFPMREKMLYRELLALCDGEVVCSDTPSRYNYLARNRYMVDHADLVFAYCVKTAGGTAYTIEYAKKRGVPVKLF